jgi:hypothetical protein
MKFLTPKKARFWCGLASATLLGLSCTTFPLVSQSQAQAADAPLASVKPNLPAKKFIEYGWDQFQSPNLSFIRDNIREMEKRPFDGMIFRLEGHADEVFNLDDWDEKKFEPQLKILADIKFEKFTDNFIAVNSASTMDWFSDNDWKKILDHTRFCARAAKIAKCKGISFDPEAYGGDRNLWYFDTKKQATGQSYDAYARQARKRGAQFMRALMSEMPDIRVLMFYQYSRFYWMTSAPSDPVTRTHPEAAADPVKRSEVANGDGFALLAPFTDGMIEAAANQVQLIDGNEPAYYYRNPLEYYQSGQAMRQDNKVFAAQDVRAKYGQYVRAGQSLYVDWVFNLRPDLFTSSVTIGMSPEDRRRWFEQNAYYALKTSDEYVWVYSEKMDWWKNEAIPEGLVEALISAKGKVERGEELGFEVTADVFKAAEEKVKQMPAEKPSA